MHIAWFATKSNPGPLSFEWYAISIQERNQTNDVDQYKSFCSYNQL